MAAPELTFDGTGNPFVEVFFDPSGFPAEVTRLTVWRYSEGREWQVRGGVSVAPGAAVLDFEVPPGSSAYRAEMFDAAGVSLGWTETSALEVPDFGVTLHNPLDPTVYVRLSTLAVLDSLLGTGGRPTVGSVLFPEGRTVGVHVGARRRGVVGLRFGVALESVADVDLLQSMLGGYGESRVAVLCVRTPQPVRVPRTLFLSVSDPEEVDFDVRWGGSRMDFLFTGTEVAPPFPGLAVPLLSYDDLDIAYPSLDARDAAYSSYTEMDRDYSLAGMAG